MTSQRLRCCICGMSTEDALDHVVLTATTEDVDTEQRLDAHAECVNGVLAPGFTIEVHLM
ncbi:hypothetical protein AN218_22875 [Streptomyces nanshensis]|uniref:Uncharacterized protein n=1 Tax=Streptomyces nanshensis TaxID=518642 RepID=A0A1E7KZD7_9ACTN|nr:hypothetical protein AN218_22875 [Streptomyces nanshensis]